MTELKFYCLLLSITFLLGGNGLEARFASAQVLNVTNESRSKVVEGATNQATGEVQYNEQLLVDVPEELIEAIPFEFSNKVGLGFSHAGSSGNMRDEVDVGFYGGSYSIESRGVKSEEVFVDTSYFAGTESKFFGAGVVQLVAWKEGKRWIIPFELEIKTNRDGRMLCKTDWKGPFELEIPKNLNTTGGFLSARTRIEEMDWDPESRLAEQEKSRKND